MIEINCKICKKLFYIKPSRIGKAKYCSSKCRGDSARKRFIKPCAICNKNFEFISTRIDKAKYCSSKCYHEGQKGKGTIKYNCVHCGVEFKSYRRLGRKYCSRKCTNKEYHKTFKPNYTTVRKTMLIRGLINRCNRCDYNKEPLILGVHHKDRNRNNNDLSNLEVLCPNCHSLEHMKHIVVHS